jgi:hypothetical protein
MVARAVVTVTVTGTQFPDPLASILEPAAAPKAVDCAADPVGVTFSTVMYTVDVEVELNVVVISVAAA